MPNIARILARLDVAAAPQAMNLPGYHVHPLKGGMRGYWAVWVTGNWRVIFRIDGGHAADVDLIACH